MKYLDLGFKRPLWVPDEGAYLLIHDRRPDVEDRMQPQTFDPLRHGFNPLRGMTYKRARELAEIFYTISPQGSDTLTLRNGKRSLARLFLKDFATISEIESYLWKKAEEKDMSPSDAEALGAISDVMLSPVLKRLFCGRDHFTFESGRSYFARIDIAGLGEFDALMIALVLMNAYPGQLVVPNLGFYGRRIHTRLFLEDRLIGGADYREQLPEELQAALVTMDVALSGATLEDAVHFAKYQTRHTPGTDGYTTYIEGATK